MKDLKHLFDVLEKVLSDPTNRGPPNTPIFQHDSQPGPDVVQLKQLLVKVTRNGFPSVETFKETQPSQPFFASNEQEENVQAAEEIGFQRPVCTTQDDLKSFQKWAWTPEFKIVVETYEPPDNPLPNHLPSLFSENG